MKDAIDGILWTLVIMSIIMSCYAAHSNDKIDSANAVIEQVRTDMPDYFYDVLVEGDTYQEYRKLNK